MAIVLGILSFALDAWVMLMMPTVDYPQIVYCVVTGLLATITTLCALIYKKLKDNSK